MVGTTAQLVPLAERAFAAFQAATARTPEIVVTPAVPILYFGDAQAYARSPRRIVTVGLNPSFAEFPTDEPFRRFPRCLAGVPDSRYLGGLNDYFRENPYRGWFSTFSGLLHGLDSCFYSDHANLAIHTDLGSPVATNPTWSKLDKPAIAHLGQMGTPIWHALLDVLRPDIILASVAWKWMSRIEFRGGDWTELHRLTKNRKRPYAVRTRRLQIADDHTSLLVWGQAAQTPFGSVSYADKVSLGQLIGELIEAR